jgi:phosphoribosylamine--glycine ligase
MGKNMRKVLVVGSGGREHAIARKLTNSPKVEKVFVAPGNGGTAVFAENVPIKADELEALANFTVENEIDITVIGPDNSLADGIVDIFQQKGLKVFGPTKAAAKLESSKAFSKKFMKDNGIPTAEYETFTDYNKAVDYLKNHQAPIVIKASGLALGKGVYVCLSNSEADQALKEIMLDSRCGDAGNEVVIEEYLEGQEVSFHAFCDGKTAKLFPTSQDHKRIFDNDKGPNTGGMGTFAPVPWVTKELMDEVYEKVIVPTLNGMDKLGSPYKGLLYPGLIITKNGIRVLEFNARFGDPETQSYMRLLESDIYDIFEACTDEKLDKIDIEWSDRSAATVVIASKGYPESSSKDEIIAGLEEAEKIIDVEIFHAGTKFDGTNYLTNGGRVLNITATGKDLRDALNKAYQAVEKINFDGMQFRKDIGAKGLKSYKF